VKDVFSTVEDRLSILEDKFKDAEEKIKAIEPEVSQHKVSIDKLYDEKADREELKDLFDKINTLLSEMGETMKLKGTMVQINNRIDKLEIKVEQILNGLGKTTVEGKQEVMGDSSEKFDKFAEDMAKKWQELSAALKEIKNGLDSKVDMSAVKGVESLLLEKIEELDNGLSKRFADKPETRKALKELEKQIKNLFDVLMSHTSASNDKDDDDAMFAKRPLGGWS